MSAGNIEAHLCGPNLVLHRIWLPILFPLPGDKYFQCYTRQLLYCLVLTCHDKYGLSDQRAQGHFSNYQKFYPVLF